MTSETDRLKADRRALHFIAECAWREKKTIEYLYEAARDFGCRIFKTESCVALFFDFGKSSTVAFRAEMDALPLSERTGLSFAAKNNMHACGHDGHMAIALEVARIVGKKGLSFFDNLLIVFEAAEEDYGGAQYLLSQPFWQEVNVTSAFALHLFPHLPFGNVFSREGTICAGTREVNVAFTGKSAHVARGEGVDALSAAVEFLARTGDEIKRSEDGFVSFGKLSGGVARNVVCARAEAEGTLRFFEKEFADKAIKKMTRAMNEICLKRGVTGTFDAQRGIPPVVNDKKLLACAKKAWEIFPAKKQLIGDDFGVIAESVPSVYFLLGAGETADLHSDAFDFDERVLRIGVDFCLAILEKIGLG